MTKYSVKQLSQLAGVSVRTLHHYDEIGLLKPAERAESGYRYYGREELLLLQQILFYKELDMPLKEIQAVFNNPEFNKQEALLQHKQELSKRKARLEKLMVTIDKTIVELKNKTNMLTDKEIYEGFTPEEVKKNRKEVKERWGEEKLIEAENNIKAMGKQEWQETKQEGEDIVNALAENMDKGASHADVQELIKQYHTHMNKFYKCSKEHFKNLGKMYVEDERFKAYYESRKVGLADFVHQAINVYCA